jgi:hypothetical protein
VKERSVKMKMRKEEYREGRLDEKVFYHFRTKRKKNPPERQEKPLRRSEVVAFDIYPTDTVTLFNEGICSEESFYSWNYFPGLNAQF